MIPLERRVWWVLEGRPDYARVPPPHYGPLVYASIAREIRYSYDHAADAAPEDVVRAEGFAFAWADVPSCGCVTLQRILVRPVPDPQLRALLVHHERSHAWLLRRGLYDATESDDWHLTATIAAPHATLLPLWFRAVAGLIEAA